MQHTFLSKPLGSLAVPNKFEVVPVFAIMFSYGLGLSLAGPGQVNWTDFVSPTLSDRNPNGLCEFFLTNDDSEQVYCER